MWLKGKYNILIKEKKTNTDQMKKSKSIKKNGQKTETLTYTLQTKIE